EGVLELADAAALPGDADADLVVGAADPGELVGLELGALGAEQRIEGGAAADSAEHGAVLGADIVEPVGEPQAAGAFEVLGADGRSAWDVPAEMAGDRAGVEVIGAADAVADIEFDVAAFVEVGRCLRRGGGYGTDEDHGRDAASPNLDTHSVTPWVSPRH